jgi:hypothetical protein
MLLLCFQVDVIMDMDTFLQPFLSLISPPPRPVGPIYVSTFNAISTLMIHCRWWQNYMFSILSIFLFAPSRLTFSRLQSEPKSRWKNWPGQVREHRWFNNIKLWDASHAQTFERHTLSRSWIKKSFSRNSLRLFTNPKSIFASFHFHTWIGSWLAQHGWHGWWRNIHHDRIGEALISVDLSLAEPLVAIFPEH